MARPRASATGGRCWPRPRRCSSRRWSASLAAGRSFLPEFNEGALTVSAVTIPGTSLADSNALGNALERLLLSVPEVTSTARRTGRAELDEHVQGVESAEIDVRLAMKDRPREAVLEELRQKVSLLPGHERHDRPADLASHRSHAVGHARQHRRQDLRRRSAGAAAAGGAGAGARWRRSPGVVDLVDRGAGRHPDAEGAGRSGRGRAAGTRNRRGRRGAADGARRPRRSARSWRGRSRFRWSSATPIDDVDRPRRRSATRRSRRRIGGRFRWPPSRRIQQDRGPNFVMRENVQRRIVVQSNVTGRDLRSVVNDIQARVGAERHAAAGLPRRVRRAVRERGAGVAPAALAVARRDRRDLLHPVDGVRIVARRPADHAEPAAGADRRRGRRLPGGRRAVGGVDRRLHHAVRHRDAQRHHARVAHPPPAGARRRDRLPDGGRSAARPSGSCRS